jgi:predicted phage baseplate assembly protein
MRGALARRRRDTRPGLASIQTRIGTHGMFLNAMLDRIDRDTESGLAPHHTRAPDDPVVALCDAWAAIGDVLTFYQERIANEAYLRTAVERRSIAEIARLVGYRMRPGVAASAHLAFTVEPDSRPTLPIGLRVQTVPVGEEPARRFELIESIKARPELNQLRVRRTTAPAPDQDLSQFFTQGTTTTLKPGDAVVLVADGEPVLRRIAGVSSEFERGRTLIRLAPHAPEAGTPVSPEELAPAAESQQEPLTIAGLADRILDSLSQPVVPPRRVAAQLRQNVLSLLAPDSDVAMRLRGFSVRGSDADNLYAALGAARQGDGPRLAVHALRLVTAPFGSTAPPRMEGGHVSANDWELSEFPNVLYVEAIANDLSRGSWVGFEAPRGVEVPPPRRIVSASVVGRFAYGMSARCTRLELDGPWIAPDTAAFGQLRMLTVYLGSATLPLAPDELTEPLGGNDEVELDHVIGDLPIGRLLIVEGELHNQPGARMSEVLVLASSRHVLPAHEGSGPGAYTVLKLDHALAFTYRRDSVVIWGNVARATEGESFSEVLGSGDGSRSGQGFTLSRAPLTHVSATTSRGAASTLQVIVNGVIWHEIDNLAMAGPNDRVFAIEPAGVAPLTIRFGNGVNGARLPTGIENIVALYRLGLGADGNCDPGQISQLMTRPAGIRGVTNPLAASGGADPESADDARPNAAAGVAALDRLVGLQDYFDFARSFAGVGKVDAVLVHSNHQPIVLVTIAGQDVGPIQQESGLVRSLAGALVRYGDPSQVVMVLPARNLRVVLSARIGLRSDYVWESVQPRLRAALLDRFGYARRPLGRSLWRSEVLAAMHEVEGVADVNLEILTWLPEPVTSKDLEVVAKYPIVQDIHVERGSLDSTAQGKGSEIAFLWGDTPELIALSVISS